jgi:ribosome-associated protein
MIVVEPDIRVPDRELQFSFVRSSGPGGQNVNKVNSKAVLRWSVATSGGVPAAVRERFFARFGSRINDAGELVLTSERYRDQPRNEEDCRQKLREMLAAVARPPKRRRKTRPTRASIERRHDQKRTRSKKKQERQWRAED